MIEFFKSLNKMIPAFRLFYYVKEISPLTYTSGSCSASQRVIALPA